MGKYYIRMAYSESGTLRKISMLMQTELQIEYSENKKTEEGHQKKGKKQSGKINKRKGHTYDESSNIYD